MKNTDPQRGGNGAEPPAPAERTGGSGEGAETAYQAMLRKRRLQVENGEPPEPTPAPPAA